MPSEERLASGKRGEEAGLRSSHRRAFGCVSWFYTAILVLLAAAFLLSVPFRYAGEREVYRVVLSIVDLYGFVLIVPGTFLAAAVGARTQKTDARAAGRAGAAGGAVLGWACFLLVSWVMNAMGLQERRELSSSVVFVGLHAGALLYGFIALSLVSVALLFVAVLPRTGTRTRERALLFAALFAVLPGLASLALAPSLLAVAGLAVSTISCALAGWVMGYGYARAGGREAPSQG
ncbi:MAG: hypothetical protein K6T51_12955 [Rubrobacteraceae bacterium]|uniref:hypothetical protein n=1 Tax=Rubrobacter naiadicus TaxID=1392641 RepID=UPI00235F064E|nr:hypothetical protein [Rubrobacter naiadicus]MCL6439510.1 hypothetical protein [Rubrobacteraceae bacterium]